MSEELDEYWGVLKPEEPAIQEMTGRVEDFRTLARLKAIDDVKKMHKAQRMRHLISQAIGSNAPLLDNEIGSSPLDEAHNNVDREVATIAGDAIDSFWKHLQEEPKHTDLTGLIQIILLSVVPATELKVFIRYLPRTLIDRILTSVQGANAGGIHALLSLEVLYRDRLENDYTLTTLSGEDIEVSLIPRTNAAGRIQFRLRDNFSLLLPTPPEDVRENTRPAVVHEREVHQDAVSWTDNDYQEPRR